MGHGLVPHGHGRAVGADHTAPYGAWILRLWQGTVNTQALLGGAPGILVECDTDRRHQSDMSFIPEHASTPPRTGERLNEQSWIGAALRRIATTNASDLRIEELARDLGVTKGSFYWHFRDRQHLLRSILDQWTERATVRVTQRSQSESADGVERLARLLSFPANLSQDNNGADVELAVRSWARHDEAAAATVARVDGMRLDYLVELLVEIGFEAHEARRRAAIAQAFMLGNAFLRSGLSQAERVAVALSCAEMVTRPSVAAAAVD